MKKMLSLVLALAMMLAPCVSAEIKGLRGFDKKVYDGSMALYASSSDLNIKDRFICSAQVVDKVNGGYELLSAGHCTPANAGLPADMTFSIAPQIGGPLTPVKLIAATLNKDEDWSIFYLETTKNLPVVPLGDENDARLNDKTIDVNFSLGLTKEVSMGLVSSKVQTSGPMAGFFEVTQFDSHGASGSSVVDERTKKVIGIVIAGVDGAAVPTWIEPISVIKKAIDKVALPNSVHEKVNPLIQSGIAVETAWTKN
jgi:hypothetical protein